MLFPVIRFAKKEYLEDLQNGKLFMRNVVYYQRLESVDTARSDPFDGAIPAPGLIPRCLQGDPRISDLNLETTRIMTFNTYVSCFFGIEAHQIDSSGHIVLSNDVANELSKFSCENALIIDLNKFAERLGSTMLSSQTNLNFGHIKYLTNEEYEFELSRLTHFSPTSQPIEFLKRDIFSNQQEFRISCKDDHISQVLNSEASATNMSPEFILQISDSFITVDIGSIQEFSRIIKLADLLRGNIQLI